MFFFIIIFYFLFFIFTKKLSILLIKNHEQNALTSQSIKLCKIIAACYEVT
jgi:hypothetical protein